MIDMLKRHEIQVLRRADRHHANEGGAGRVDQGQIDVRGERARLDFMIRSNRP
jgi:hypothetical protein